MRGPVPHSFKTVCREMCRLLLDAPFEARGIEPFSSNSSVFISKDDLALDLNDLSEKFIAPAKIQILSRKSRRGDDELRWQEVAHEWIKAFDVRVLQRTLLDGYTVMFEVTYRPTPWNVDIPLYNWLGMEAEAA